MRKNILDKIVLFKKKELEKEKKKLALREIKKRIVKNEFDKRNFKKALKKNKLSLIAEIKKASPSEGIIKKKFNIKNIIKEFKKANINAISVLTDKKFFKGDINYLPIIRKLTKLPILRKDFIIDTYQIYESKLYGADAILLISSILDQNKIKYFLKIAKSLGMDCLVEVHNQNELSKALKAKAEIIGINNRNLKTFKIDLKTTLKLSKKIPKNKIIVSESGINKKEDILKLHNVVNAVLIGTTLMKSKNIKEKINELINPKVKICGITNRVDALRAINLGADYLGFIFYKKTPRYITKEKAKNIIKALPKNIQKIGVFVNEDIKKIKHTMNFCNLNLIQLSGNESPNYVKKLKKTINKKIIKAIHIKNKKDFKKIRKYNVDYFLFDTYHKQMFGGTGKTFNYSSIKTNKNNFFLSGGLNPDNIIKSVRKVRPYAVDVNSGVEKKPGKKDISKLKKLFVRLKNEV